MKFSEHFFKTPRFWVAAFSTSILALSMFVSSLRTDYAEQQRTYQLAEMAAIAKATGAIPPGWTSQPERQAVAFAEQNTSQTSKAKSTIDLSRTDNCEGKPSTSVNADTQSLRVIGKSCVFLKLSGSVTTLQGKWYEIAVPVPNVPNNYYKCGTVDGRNDSEAQCAQFATRYSGREMYITVFEGGNVQL